MCSETDFTREINHSYPTKKSTFLLLAAAQSQNGQIAVKNMMKCVFSNRESNFDAKNFKNFTFADSQGRVGLTPPPPLTVSLTVKYPLFIRPESDHCLLLSLTHWLTNSCLANLIDVTLAYEDTNTKLVDVVTVTDEDPVDNNLLHISKLRLGKKAKLLFKFWAQSLVKIFKFRQDLKVEFGQCFSADVL